MWSKLSTISLYDLLQVDLLPYTNTVSSPSGDCHLLSFYFYKGCHIAYFLGTVIKHWEQATQEVFSLAPGFRDDSLFHDA